MADWRTNDRELLARILMAEAGNQGPVGMTAVGNVIMNRANTSGYGDGIRGVIMKPGQFSPMNSVTGYAGGEQGQNIDSLRPSETHYMVADALLSGNAGDITGGATHFFNPGISNPSWAKGKDFKRIGDHVFGSADAARGGPQATRTTQGASPMTPTQTQPQGILEMMGVQRRDPSAQGDTALPFYQRDQFKNMMGGIAMAANTLRQRPDQNINAQVMAGRDQREQNKEQNRTVAYLRANGRGDLADMIEQGMIGGKDAAGIMLAKPEDNRTALMQNYEYFIAQGMTPEQAMAAVKTGSTTNVNMPKTVGAPPTGYRFEYDESGNPVSMSPIPGSPAEVEQEAAKKAADSAVTDFAELAAGKIKLIDDIINDPALPSITGLMQGRLPPMTQAGEDLDVKISQVKGQVFLDAFQSLRGAGSITEAEAAAAVEAGARLKRTQSGPAYVEALNELKMYLDRGRRRALAGVTASDGDSYSSGNIGGVNVGAPIQ